MRKLIALIAGLAIALMSFSTLGAETEENYYSIVLKSDAQVEKFKGDLSLTDAEIVYEVPEIGYYQVKGTEGDLNQIKKFSTVQAANTSLSWKLDEFDRFNMTEEQISQYLPQTEEDTKGNKGNGKGKKSGDLSGDLNASATNPTEAGLWSLQWDIHRITETGASYDLHTGSHDTVVAVIDTGIDPDHMDLAPNLLPGSENFVPAGGFAGQEPYETGDPDDFQDKHGHGSHVSGSIAGAGYGMAGVAPDLGIRAYRVFGLGSAQSAWILKAMVEAADDGSDVLSMSLGGWNIFGQVFVKNEEGKWVNAGNDVADFIAYKRAAMYAESKGSTIVVAAGNDALDLNNNNQVMDFLNAVYGSENVEFRGTAKTIPAELSNVITVSATGPNDVLANYSNYGAGVIDIATPGGDARLYDQYLAEGRFDEYINQRLFETEFNLSASETGGWYWSIGTSMATPKVSAVAGLIIDQHGGDLSPAEVKNMLLKNSVDEVSDTDHKYFGNGHLNAYKALQ